MKCFNHHDRDAIGLCKSCGKGLCEECIAEVPRGLACKNSCEENARQITELIQKNIALHNQADVNLKKTQKRILFNVIVLMLFGLILVIVGFVDGFDLPMLILAIFFISLAISSFFYRPKSLPKKDK